MNFGSERNRERLFAVFLLLVFLALLASRRWGQLIAPQVWDEESWVIRGFIDHGWREVIQPINGYLMVVPKAIVCLSMTISLFHLPAIATTLAWTLTALIGVAIAMSPTRLNGRVLCALAAFAVPSDPEVFGIPLYTLWWLSLPLFLLAVWDEAKPSLGLRMSFLIVGGLSSPVIVALLPVFILRAWWFRAFRAEKWLALVATLLAATQACFAYQVQAANFPSLGSIASHVPPKFFGAFLVGNLSESRTVAWMMGLAVLGLIVAFVVRDRRNVVTWILLFLLVAAVGMTISRVDPQVPHPRLAGPRYFFFPFVITSWAVIQCIHRPNPGLMRCAAAAMLLLALVNAWPVWVRGIKQDDLRWADHLRSAPHFPEYTIPNQFDGSQLRPWRYLRDSGAGWARVIDGWSLIPAASQQELPTFPYRIPDSKEMGPGGLGTAVVVPEDRKLIVPMSSPAAGRSELVVQLNRGERVYFRSGPGPVPARMSVVEAEHLFIEEMPLTAGWVILEFSNAKLPATFTLRVDGVGTGVGEWAKVETPR